MFLILKYIQVKTGEHADGYSIPETSYPSYQPVILNNVLQVYSDVPPKNIEKHNTVPYRVISVLGSCVISSYLQKKKIT